MANFVQKLIIKIFPELYKLKSPEYNFNGLKSWHEGALFGKHTKINPVSRIYNSSVGDYSYISENSFVNGATIGKFCSIGPNFFCGWGIHPTNGLSTAPMFYSKTHKPNGITLSKADKAEERKQVAIGNDVFIGANVTVLEGITIGHGAVIGAGAVVSKNIPPYAIAVGSPIAIKRYRFTDEQINALLKIEWWNFAEEQLQDVEKMFFDINGFIAKYSAV
ncbi:MAG: CatB-related O-acetyltransferase [Bacteroidales bacterium]|nr:CatB-related O-acetyltransferase [Bacteroidales bacterium]